MRTQPKRLRLALKAASVCVTALPPLPFKHTELTECSKCTMPAFAHQYTPHYSPPFFFNGHLRPFTKRAIRASLHKQRSNNAGECLPVPNMQRYHSPTRKPMKRQTFVRAETHCSHSKQRRQTGDGHSVQNTLTLKFRHTAQHIYTHALSISSFLLLLHLFYMIRSDAVNKYFLQHSLRRG